MGATVYEYLNVSAKHIHLTCSAPLKEVRIEIFDGQNDMDLL